MLSLFLRRWMPALSVFAVVLLNPLSGFAAPAVTATLDREVVTMGESITLTLTLQDVNVEGPPVLPPLPNVTLAGVSPPSAFTININGQVTSKISYGYSLVPTQPGEVTIPAIVISVGGQQLMTQTLKFKVQNASAVPEANKNAFVKLVIPKTELYIGEAMPVEIHAYALAFGEETRLPRIESPGVMVATKIVQGGQTRTRIGDQIFMLITFKTFVAPVKAGTLPLGPATIQAQVPRQVRRTIFGNVIDWQTLTLATEIQNLTVLPLPTTNVPPTFNGSVGVFSMRASVAPTNVALGDPITVKVAISGQGLLDSLALPNQPEWGDFKVYPPTSKLDANDQFGLSGTKSFEQVVVPQKQEISVLPPIQFSFFDPNARSYRTLSGPAVGLIVRPTASIGALPTLFTPGQPGITNDAIVHIKPYLGVSPVMGAPLIQQPWFLALQGVPVVTWLSLLVVRKRQEALARNPRLRRQREVERKVTEGLKELRRQAGSQESDAFFATVFRLLQEQLGERLDLPASAITEAVIDERLRSRSVPDSILTALHELFHVCNQARYAPQRTSHELATYVGRVETTLKELQTIKA